LPHDRGTRRSCSSPFTTFVAPPLSAGAAGGWDISDALARSCRSGIANVAETVTLAPTTHLYVAGWREVQQKGLVRLQIPDVGGNF
jgi:hypothetical protein